MRYLLPNVLPWSVLVVIVAWPCGALIADDDSSPQLMPIVRSMPAMEPAAPAGSSATSSPAVAAATDAPSAPHLYVNSREVRAPLDPATCEGVQPGRDQAVVLYVSGNRGRTWVRTQKRTLPTAALEFRAVTDGTYWAIFRGEAVASRGADPLPGARPDLIITVDTSPPQVASLTASAARENEPVRIAWQVSDPGSSIGGVKIAAAQGQSKETLPPQEVTPSPEGSALVGPLSAGTWDFAVTFVDLAGNMTTACCRTTVTPVAAAQVAAEPAPAAAPSPPPASTPVAEPVEASPTPTPVQPVAAPQADAPVAPPSSATSPAPTSQEPRMEPVPPPASSMMTSELPAAAPRPSPVAPVTGAAESPSPEAVAPARGRGDQWVEPGGEVRATAETPLLRSRMLSISYTWDEEHPPDRVGLWVTTDGGRTWQLDHVAERLTGLFVFQAPADGVYGFHTHREAGGNTWGVPLSGEAPQMEIIVDTEPPRVQWTSPLGVEAAGGAARQPVKVTGTAVLAWQATDANLGKRPARLDWRAFGQTLWQPIAADLPGSGSYTWTVPEAASGTLEVRITVLDRAGHLASADVSLEIVRPAAAETPPPSAAPTTEQASQDAVAESQRAYAMATLSRLQENWADAERQLQRATTLNPDHVRAWVDLGGIYAAGRRWDPAVDAYRKAVTLQPENVNALLGLSRSLAARGDTDGALRTVETLLNLSPTDGDALVLHGDLLWKSGRHDEARQSWLRALDSGGGHEGRLAAIQKRLQLKR